MKLLLAIMSFGLIALSLSQNVLAEDINYRHMALVQRYQLFSKVMEDDLKTEIDQMNKYIPTNLREKIADLRSGTDKKTAQCLSAKHSLTIHQKRMNTVLQELETRKLYKRLASQRLTEFFYNIDEYKREALLAQKECHDAEESVEHMKASLEFLTKARVSLTGGFTINNNAN